VVVTREGRRATDHREIPLIPVRPVRSGEVETPSVIGFADERVHPKGED
jgi:hypothetical protein